MTPKAFSQLVEQWGGDDEAARRLHIKPRTVRALRTGERRITERMTAFIAMLPIHRKSKKQDKEWSQS